MSRIAFPEQIQLSGLKLGSPQVWGGIRLVPVLRYAAPGDLRLRRGAYGDDMAMVALKGDPSTAYVSYIPHGLVVSWSDDGLPVAAFGAQLKMRDSKPHQSFSSVRIAHRMVKREGRHQLRLLPLHLALEGFLALHFGGPDIAWREYANHAVAHGLGGRFETGVSGPHIQGLGEALRVFEIHEYQVGALLFVADALGAAFIVSHPDDYRALHRSLLLDVYGELLYHYACHTDVVPMWPSVEATEVATLDDVERALTDLRQQWSDWHAGMSDGLLNRAAQATWLYRAGPFHLFRFMTALQPKAENHIGEAILRADGSLEYLKTYRLSAAQTRRAILLSDLTRCNWRLNATAAARGESRAYFIRCMEKAGLGYLLTDEVLRAAQRRKK